jgi:hypothetical protein
MSTEEFFMYLTIGLIILVPVTVRVYRYLTAKRVQQMLRQEFGKTGAQGRPQDPGKKP